MTELAHAFATRTGLVRRAIEAHQSWIEGKLHAPLSEIVILRTDTSFCDMAIPHLVGYVDRSVRISKARRALIQQIEAFEIPAGQPPFLELAEELIADSDRTLSEEHGAQTYSAEWLDLPVYFRIAGCDHPLISMSVSLHLDANSPVENTEYIVIVGRDGVGQVVSLLQQLRKPDGDPKLVVVPGEARTIRKCGWDRLVLDACVISMLKDDFEAFFHRRESFFQRLGLPWRRGYLLHGRPGNGKSSAIAAMLTSRGLTGYTLRFGHPDVDDEDLDRLFSRAARNAPSLILLEDIDKIAPRNGHSPSKISVQHLTNTIDGVGTGEGIVLVATSNSPSNLDPALIKRPGRFDRVIHFADPSLELRRQYLCKMQPTFSNEGGLEDAITESEGFSFAQLRESFIAGSQRAFEQNTEIRVEDLLDGVRTLRASLQLSTRPIAGFSSFNRNRAEPVVHGGRGRERLIRGRQDHDREIAP